MRCAELRDAILFHAAQAADENEAAAVRLHLDAGCAACRAALAEAETTLALLPLALEPVDPGPELRARLLARVAGRQERARAAVQAPSGGAPAPSGEQGSRGARAPVRTLPSRPLRAMLAAVGLAACAAWLLAFVATQRGRLDLERQLERQEVRARSLEHEVGQARAMLRVLRSPAVRVVSLAGAEPQPAARGRVFWDARRGEGWFFAADLRPPGPGRTYELWYITLDGRKVAAGTFDVDRAGAGETRVRLPPGLGTIAAAAVTDEPAGGVPQPTGAVHLVGAVGPSPS